VSANALRERPSRPFALDDGEELVVRVRESQRARTARLVVGPRRPLEVIVPRRTRDRDIDAFLAAQRRWINAKVARARAIASRPPQLALERPMTAWLAGVPIPIERMNGRRSTAYLSEGRLIVRGPASGTPAALARWYRREARQRLTESVGRQAERLGVEYHSVAVRDPKTRWGSCSSRGNLSFSWRLVLAPAEVLDYVVVHELLHLREPNHSRAFWRLVEAAMPGWQEHTRWLHEHGQELQDFRPDPWLSQRAVEPE
jgi:predicted metal-dependent hydrolase